MNKSEAMHANINSWMSHRIENVPKSCNNQNTILIIGPNVLVSCKLSSTLNHKNAAMIASRKFSLKIELADYSSIIVDPKYVG
jgi:hypothetical protein